MPPRIERHRVVARVPQGLAGPFPGVPGLPTPVLQDDQRPVGVPPCVPSNRETSRPNPGVHRHRRAR